MAKITVVMVKELREHIDLGMVECRKALTTVGGDIEKAIDSIRAASAIKAAKKAGSTVVEGSIVVKIAADNKAVMIIEVDSQTNFLTLQDDFKGFVAESLEEALNEKLTDAAPLIEAREEARLALVAKTGENVSIHRLTRIEGDVVGAYLHGHRIGVVASLKGGNPELVKSTTMHIVTGSPQFLNASEVSEETVAEEKEIFLALNADKIAGKPENIVENMVRGRISKFLAEASLIEQSFVKNPEVKVGNLAKQAGAEIVSFVRYEVGEDIEETEVDFTTEIATQVAATRQ